jgi:hypothetical protein
VGAARFESHVERRATGRGATLASVAQGVDFRVWLASATVPALPDDFAALHEHSADHRIRREVCP